MTQFFYNIFVWKKMAVTLGQTIAQNSIHLFISMGGFGANLIIDKKMSFWRLS